MFRNQIIKVSPALSKAADSKGRAFVRRPQSAKPLSVQAPGRGLKELVLMKKVVGGNPAREGSPYERAFCRARRDSFRSLYVVGAVQSRPVSLASGVPPVRDRTGQFFPRVDFAALGSFQRFLFQKFRLLFPFRQSRQG